jgi:hypothetical protein
MVLGGRLSVGGVPTTAALELLPVKTRGRSSSCR